MTVTRFRSIGLVAVLALAVASGPVQGQMQEEQTQEEEPATTSAPEVEPPAEPIAEPDPAATTDPSTPGPTGEVSQAAAPIEAVHRPGGVPGAVAIAADLLVMRPLGLVSLAVGSGAYVLMSPFAAATRTLGDRADALLDRAKNVFTRPLGAL